MPEPKQGGLVLMPSRSSRLISIYEQCLQWLRSPRSQRFGGPTSTDKHSLEEPIQAVRVDLVGPTTFGSSPNPINVGLIERDSDGRESGSDLAPQPFRSSITRSGQGLSRSWQFNQTVLLNKKRRSSSLLVWTAVGTVSAVGIWAVTAPLTETIAVQGKLEPGSSTKRIDAPVPGVVEAVLVKEGQSVRKGDPLVRFDLRDPRSKLAAAESVRERLINDNRIAAATLGEASASAGLTDNQRRQLASQAEEFSSRRDVARQELRKAESRVAGLQNTLITYNDIANRYADLARSGAVSEVQLLEARNRMQETRSRLDEEQREISRLEASLINTGASTNVDLRRRIEDNLREISRLDSDIRLARQQIQYGQLISPSDGVVFNVEISPGSVVAQGAPEPMLKVVPQDALQAKVYLPNKAVGFVRTGQRAELSIDTFQASDFGYIRAVVERIGSDAITAEEQTRVLGTDEKGLFYPAILRLERQTIRLNKTQAPLQAGMSLTADIQLRQRRVISILTGFFDDQRRNLERLR